MSKNREHLTGPKRVFSIIATVISAVLFALVVVLLVDIIICRTQNKPVRICGVSFSIVLTNSMEDEIMTGDLILFKSVDASSLKVGDNIVFRADDNFKDGSGKSLKGYTIVHKIIEITPEGFITKGVNNYAPDTGIRSSDDIYGLCIANSAFLGSVFAFLSKYGVLIIIFLIAVPVIVSQTIKIVKLAKKNKQEVNEENIEED